MAAKRASSACSSVSVPVSCSSAESTTAADTTAATSTMSASSSISISKAASDLRTILFEEEYQDEVIQHMHHMETQTMASVELMDAQPELRWFMRPYLVDFLIEIHQTFRLRPETLFLTMNVVDRYVSKRIVYKRHYQLVGCAALLIAAKFEDSKDRVPTVADLSQMCCNAYDESAFSQMEGHVLSTIGWTLGHPTAEAWLRIESIRGEEDLKTVNLARFFLEISLFHKDFITLKSSSLTKGALILARFINGQPQYSNVQPSDEATKAAHMLDAYVSESLRGDPSLILMKKYSYAYFSSASTVICDYYRARQEAANKSASGLLPAQAPICGQIESTVDMDDDESMCSQPATPSSSVQSTPSRSMDEDRDDEDDEDEEEDEMPVTPLSLYSLHDPLVAAAAGGLPRTSSSPSRPGKAQQHLQQQSKAASLSTSSAHLSPSAASRMLPKQHTHTESQIPSRPALATVQVQWNVNIQQF